MQYDYNQTANGIANGIRGVAQALMQRPRLRAMAEQQAQRDRVADSQIRYNNARTSTEQAKAKQIQLTQSDLDVMQQYGPGFLRAVANGNPDDPALDKFLGVLARRSGTDPNTLKDNLPAIAALISKDPKLAARLRDPVREQDSIRRAETSRANVDAMASNRLAIAGIPKPQRNVAPTETILQGRPAVVSANGQVQFMPQPKQVVTSGLRPVKDPVTGEVLRQEPYSTTNVTSYPTAWSTAPTNAPSQPVPQTVNPADGHPDGTVIRQKSTGKLFVVKDGQLIEQPAQ